MHEMSLVEGLLDAIRQELRAYPDARVKTVTVRVGALRLVVPDIMTLCFEAATRDTELAGAQLNLEPVPAAARCRRCHAEFAVEKNWFQCPHCADASGILLTGDELDLVGLELDRQLVGAVVST